MVSFTNRKIVTSETLGEKLEKVRQGRNLSLEQTAKECQIQAKYLAALENGDYQILPGEIYVRQFLKTYARFLGLDPSVILELYQKEQSVFQNINSSSEEKDGKYQNGKHFVISQFFKKFFLILIILAIFIYLGWEVTKIVIPPPLTIISPIDSLVTSERTIKIIGETLNGAKVTINNQLVSNNQEGHFEEIIDLQSGLNTITISASRKYGREKVVTRTILVQEKSDEEYHGEQ